MIKSEHTPAPWKVEFVGSSKLPCVTAADDELICFEIKTPFRTKEESLANANLLAAAPKLLEAINLANDFLNSLPKGWLGKTTGDVGALNDFYIIQSQALAQVEGKKS